MTDHIRISLIIAITLSATNSANASDDNAINHWIETEFVHSSIPVQEQKQELQWFANVAKPYKGLSIRVISENIATHRYESEVLAKAFADITGIHVIHEVTEEDDLVKKMQLQFDTGVNLYDSYVNDADFIGTHSRFNNTTSISHKMNDEWKALTLPTIDIYDFIGIDHVKGLDGQIYQLPTQQFANLYWYRKDWFERPDLRDEFRQIYGYTLGVPQNWSAYEDIADFFTNKVRHVDGEPVWGHMDYGLYDPSLGWRISDSWLSLAGVNDTRPYQIQNRDTGYVGDWGIRVENCRPVGASVSRGGALNSPAAIYAVQKYIDWLHDYAPPDAVKQNFSSSSITLAKGNTAQQIFWYTAFVPTLLNKKLIGLDGKPVWRIAPSPRGKYWQPGMKSGYQDISGWTFLKSTPSRKAEAAWLYAQFVTSKTVTMSKFLVGFTPIRQSDLDSEYLASRASEWGGLLEFYRSEARSSWTPTGLSVPDYGSMSSAWWQHIGSALSNLETVSDAMTALAVEMDKRMDEIAKKEGINCAPELKKSQTDNTWLSSESAPWIEDISKDEPITLPYEEALLLWKSH
jgi:glycerol transport system substrate-binding protein